MTGKVSYRRRVLVVGAVVLVAVCAVAAAVALSKARGTVEQQANRPLTVGDCVVVAPSRPNEVEGQRASCAADPSYTVGALADMSGSCPTAEYQHFAAPVADRAIAGLCLVPNLVADHCYRLDMPIGVVEKAECSDPQSSPNSGILVQVTRKLDIHDQHACPQAGDAFAWPYPSPARTYCTTTIY